MITVTRIYALTTYAYDLGVYNQALHSTLSGKGLLYYTADLQANPTGSIFGVHVTPILLILLPIYAVYPYPGTLLVIQSFVLAFGAIPVYYLAKLKINSSIMGLVFAGAFLLSPALQGVNWYDFHPEAFIILPMLLSMYFSEKGNNRLYLLASAFVLLAVDKAALLVLVFALYKIISSINIKSIDVKDIWQKSRIYIIALFVSILWFFITSYVVTSLTPFNQYVGETSQYWKTLGANSLVQIPIRVVLSPSSTLNAILFDGISKLLYVTLLLGPLLFSGLRSLKALILLVPWLGPALLSDYLPYYQLGDQYPAYVIPAVFYCSIIGSALIFERLRKSSCRLNMKKIFGSMMVISIAIVFFASTPVIESGVGRLSWFKYGLPNVPEHTPYVNEFVELVPPNSSIITQSNLFPLVSSRDNAYVVPGSVFYPSGYNFDNSLDRIINEVDYVLVDVNTDILNAGLLLGQETIRKDFGLLASADGVILLKRGYIGEPTIFKAYTRTYNYNNLVGLDNVVRVNDSFSTSKTVLQHSGAVEEDFWYGPYVYLPPGSYQVDYRVKIEKPVTGEVLTLRVGSWTTYVLIEALEASAGGHHLTFSVDESGSKKEYATKSVNGEELHEGEYAIFSLKFDVETFGVYEFMGVGVKTPVAINIDTVNITQISPGFAYSTTIISTE